MDDSRALTIQVVQVVASPRSDQKARKTENWCSMRSPTTTSPACTSTQTPVVSANCGTNSNKRPKQRHKARSKQKVSIFTVACKQKFDTESRPPHLTGTRAFRAKLGDKGKLAAIAVAAIPIRSHALVAVAHVQHAARRVNANALRLKEAILGARSVAERRNELERLLGKNLQAKEERKMRYIKIGSATPL